MVETIRCPHCRVTLSEEDYEHHVPCPTRGNLMNSNKTEVRAFPAPWWGGVEFSIRRTDLVSGRNYVLLNPEFSVLEDGGEIREPSIRMSTDAAQTLMDDLWNCGIRPTHGHGSAGQLGATERHLEDMRRIVEGNLDVTFDKRTS